MGGRGSSGGGRPERQSAEYRDVMKRLPDTPEALDIDAMPALQGTEKQVKWAEKIRYDLVTDLADYATNYTSDGRRSSAAEKLAKGKKAMADDVMSSPLVTATAGGVRQEKINNHIQSYVDAAERWKRVISLVKGHTNSSFWIDHRTNQLKNYMNQKLKAYIDGK